MDIRELRIGNYVRFTAINKGKVFAQKVTKVDSISSYGECENFTFSEYSNNYFEPDDANDTFTILCEPIPLTEDILLKCGFEWTEMYASSGGDSLYFKVLHKPIFKEFQYLQTNSFNYNVQFVADGRCVTTVKYLHQLQNLIFILSGEELNVEL